MKSDVIIFDKKYRLTNNGEDNIYIYRMLKDKEGNKVKDEYQISFDNIASIDYENLSGKMSNVKYFMFAALVFVVLYSFPFSGIVFLLPVVVFYIYTLYKNSFMLRILTKDDDLIKVKFNTQAEAAHFGKMIRKKVGFVKNTFYYRKHKVLKFFKYS